MPDDIELLESQLLQLSRTVRYPPTPSLAPALRRRLEAEWVRPGPPAPRLWPPPIGRQALVAFALAAAVALALALGLWSPGREAVADFFERIRIFRADEVSEEGLPRGITGTATPLPTEIVGTPVPLAEAEALLGFPVRLPTYPAGIESSLTGVLYQDFEQSQVKAVALQFERPTGPGFTLFETNARVGKGLLSPDASAQPVGDVGNQAYWLQGRRIVQYYDPQGNVVRDSIRVTEANTLVWDADGFVFRLEGDLSREEAIRIAQSLR